jgi:hypothetical protein
MAFNLYQRPSARGAIFCRSDVLSGYSLATVPFGSEAPLSRKYWDMIASVFNIPSL